MDKFAELIKQIETMSVADLHALVKALEEKFGVSAAAVAAAPAGSAAAPAAEEKDAFTVVLAKPGEQKIQVIKVLRELTGLGLKEVKDMTDKEGSIVKEGVKAAEAQEWKKKLQDAGAVVELK